jgi:serine/threonine-protein kinase
MAEIDFKCPECSKSVKSDDSLCGEFMTCPSCSSEITIPIPGLTKGVKLGDFEILEKLGSGSMGEVWLAYQETMDRKVALKILAPKYASDSKFIDRFMSEVKNSAKLSHPNIVTAFYAGTDKGHYYLAISYVSGKTVEDVQAEKGIYNEKDALKVILSITKALTYAWDEFKILHRDIKPGNIMINKRGEAMLLDLGIAKSMEEESNLTMTGTVVGTPYYISPEQAMALTDIDFRADMYSLGTTLYHMVTGRVPYNATTAMAIIMKHINEDFPTPSQYNSELSPECARLIEIMMSKEREKRHRSWGELRKDIELVLAGKMPESVAAPSDETIIAEKPSGKKSGDEKNAKVAPKKGKKQIIVIAAVVAVIILIAVIVLIAGIIFTTKEKVPDSPQSIVGPVMPPEIKIENQKNIAKTETTNADIPAKMAEQVAKIEIEKKEITKPGEKKEVTIQPIEKTEKVEEVAKKEEVKKEVVVPEKPIIEPGSFNQFCHDLLNQTSLSRRSFWAKNDDRKVTWTGIMVDVKGRPGKYELHLNNKSHGTYKGFNMILVSYTDDGSVPALKIGDNVTFTGNLYNYRLKSNNVVIPYIKNVIIDSPKRAGQ